MPKSDSVYICQNCEASFPKWQGQCSSCQQWNTLVEELKPSTSSKPTAARSYQPSSVVSFSQVKSSSGAQNRLGTGFAELDRVIGGGVVPGAVMLMGGEPGIGKSTLLTQVVVRLAASSSKDISSILYVSGEENPSQISLRINRIIDSEHTTEKGASPKARVKTIGSKLEFFTRGDVDELCMYLKEKRPQLVIVDSIQTMTTQELTGAAGSVGQLREVADRLTDVAKQFDIPIFLIGHVTKDGNIAGPKVLEHIVDAVVEISGERTGQLRIVRAIKNRFGATDEVGVFKHTSWGLEEVTNPTEFFLEHSQAGVPGSATVCVMEGTRPLLMEVQSLVVSSQLAMPRRVGRGIDLARIQVLAAVLQKQSSLPLGTHDIFASAAGGLRVTEPAIDLGLAVAMVSSLRSKAVPSKTIFIGEVGLLGEVRSVSYLDQRIKEAKRLGYTKIYSRKNCSSVAELITKLGLTK